ncbi:MAG: hypothetical protein GX929_06900 [Clostridiales bacterium]|nr:hypothetical protein [Clostridiales bacterium]
MESRLLLAFILPKICAEYKGYMENNLPELRDRQLYTGRFTTGRIKLSGTARMGRCENRLTRRMVMERFHYITAWFNQQTRTDYHVCAVEPIPVCVPKKRNGCSRFS